MRKNVMQIFREIIQNVIFNQYVLKLKVKEETYSGK